MTHSKMIHTKLVCILNQLQFLRLKTFELEEIPFYLNRKLTGSRFVSSPIDSPACQKSKRTLEEWRVHPIIDKNDKILNLILDHLLSAYDNIFERQQDNLDFFIEDSISSSLKIQKVTNLKRTRISSLEVREGQTNRLENEENKCDEPNLRKLTRFDLEAL